jgi:hypothetical protein
LPTAGYQIPSYEDLLREHRITDGWSEFSEHEVPTAEFLRRLGIDTLSVLELHGAAGKSPDAVIGGTTFTVEFKRPASSVPWAIGRAMSEAEAQSRRLVVVLRAAGTTRGDAIRGLRVSLEQRGGNFDEVLVLGDGFGILWP